MTHLFKDLAEKKDEGMGLQKKSRSFFAMGPCTYKLQEEHILMIGSLGIDDCKATTT